MNTVKKTIFLILGTASGLIGIYMAVVLGSCVLGLIGIRRSREDFTEGLIMGATLFAFFTFLAFRTCFGLLNRAVLFKKPNVLVKGLTKMVGWALGMAAGVALITDGKGGVGPNVGEHVLIGGLMGLILGCLFGWQQRSITHRPE